MDSKYKTLLQHHRPFLSRNLIWSKQFSDMLKSHGLITDFMIKDINACSTREEQIHRLIDVIPLKGNGAFPRFLDVLMLSGHVFISDFLREDEDNQKLFDVKEMYKALPFVQRAFNDTEKKAIETYMADKIENQVLKLLWKRDNREKDKALDAKMKQIEQSYEFEEHHKEKAATIHTLEKEIHSALENKQELKGKITALTTAHREAEARHKQAMDVQMRFNSANDNAIEKAKTTIADLETLLRALHTKMDAELASNEKEFPQDLSPHSNYSSSGTDLNTNSSNNNNHNNKNNDRMNTTMSKISNKTSTANNNSVDPSLYKSQFGFVLGDLDNLIARYRYLLTVKINHDRLMEEKEYILIHFGYPKNEEAKQKAGGGGVGGAGVATLAPEPEPSMIRAYKDYAVRQDENMDKMKKQLEKYDGLLTENKAKLEGMTKEKEDNSKRMTQGISSWQGAIMNVMRNQLQDLKTDSRKKESMMSMQEEEMSKLKHKIAELENRLACTAFSNPPDTLSVFPSRDMVDGGRLSAISNDSVELIVSETPKPTRNKNLPPLKSSTKPAMHSGAANKPGGSSSPRGTVMRSSKHPVIPGSRNGQETSKNYITFPIGPITTQLKPDTRGRPMGSVLGDLKAMNKHHKPGALENPKSAWKQNGSASLIK